MPLLCNGPLIWPEIKGFRVFNLICGAERLNALNSCSVPTLPCCLGIWPLFISIFFFFQSTSSSTKKLLLHIVIYEGSWRVLALAVIGLPTWMLWHPLPRYLESKLLSHHFSSLCPSFLWQCQGGVPIHRWVGTSSFVCEGAVWEWNRRTSLPPSAPVWMCTLWLKGVLWFSFKIESLSWISFLTLYLWVHFPPPPIASPSRQLYSYRAMAGHLKIPMKTLKGKCRITSD